MRWRSVSLAASSCALLLAGCGGGGRAAPKPRPPRIPADVAQQLATEADQVAAASTEDCSARGAATRLRQDVIAAIQSGRVPPRYQEPLLSSANDLVDRIGACTPQPQGEKHGRDKHKKKPPKHERAKR